VVAEKPRRGGTWRLGAEIFAAPPSLDNDRRGGATVAILMNVSSCKLVMWDERPDRTPGLHENVIPDLAERWENSADGKVWTFYLRKGVMLPPPLSREVTAEDIKRSILRRQNLVAGRGMANDMPWLFTDPTTGKLDKLKPNLEILDKYTIRFTLTEVDADFLSQSGGHSGFTIHFVDYFEPTPDGWGDVKKPENIRGCGPFMASEYVVGSRFTFVRNPNYYNKELPYLDAVENRLIFETSVAAAALRSGQLDSWGQGISLPISLAKELETAPGVQVKWEQPAWVWPWTLDLKNPPLNDVRVRRAIALALDRKSWIKDLYFGRGQNVVMMHVAGLEFWNLPPEKMGEAGKYFTTYDPEAAKKLLKEAGYPNGFSFTMLTSNAGAHVVANPMLELSQAYLEAVGIKMKIDVMDYGAYQRVDHPVGGAKQGGLWRPNVSTWVYGLYHYQSTFEPQSGIPRFGKMYETDPEYRKAVALMEEQRRTIDVKKRLELIHELQRVWAQGLWTFHYPIPDTPVINTPKVRGYNPIPGWNGGTWKYVWLAE